MVELDRFVQRTIDDYPTMWSFYDPHWRSPCEMGDPEKHDEDMEPMTFRASSVLLNAKYTRL